MYRAAVLFLLLAATSADASLNPTDKPATPPSKANIAENGYRWTVGPAKIPLGYALTLDLPAGFLFLDRGQGAKLMTKMGNFYNQNLLGLVESEDQSRDFLVTIRYEDEGYVKDDEQLDANEILKTIREGTEEANKERQSRGFKPIHIEGWDEPPRYEREVHHLVWALRGSSEDGVSVNFSTRILGRHGFVSLNLITAPENLVRDKPAASALLAATHFDAGACYEDFKAGSDKVAKFGLTALIAGGAGVAALKLVKVGLLAKFGKVLIGLLLAGKKLIALAFAAVAMWVRRLFGKEKTKNPPDSNTT